MIARMMVRAGWRLAAGLAAGMLSLGVAVPTSAAQTQVPAPVQAPMPVPVQIPLPVGACTSSQLAGSFVSGQGAAGTLVSNLQLLNTSASSCTLDGYVSVQLFDGGGAPLPTVDVPGGGIMSNFPGPSPFTLAPGQAAGFAIAWSDVPSDGETTCPMADSLGITPPGGSTALLVAVPELAPCNGGTVDVGPLRAPGVPVVP